MRISDWSSDVCSSDLTGAVGTAGRRGDAVRALVQAVAACRVRDVRRGAAGAAVVAGLRGGHRIRCGGGLVAAGAGSARRSEEHTSELQSLMRISYAVFCLKKKQQKQIKTK